MTMRLRNVAFLMASLMCSACHIGGTAATYQPATKAEGALMLITTDAGRLVGELVEVAREVRPPVPGPDHREPDRAGVLLHRSPCCCSGVLRRSVGA